MPVRAQRRWWLSQKWPASLAHALAPGTWTMWRLLLALRPATPQLMASVQDESEISFNEFSKLLARVCDCKIPSASSSGVPFDVTLDSWLGLQVVPKYKQLLKDKKMGLGSDRLVDA